MEFLPAIPIPLQFDIEGRIKLLRALLDPSHPEYLEYQKINIKAAIALYEGGTINTNERRYIWFSNGKMVPFEEAMKSGEPVWIEVTVYNILLSLNFFILIFQL
jgi:hypothetical protein